MSRLAFGLLVVLLIRNVAAARIWTDSTGKYTLEADLIAYNDKTVILERPDHQLGQVRIEQLSQADREYLKSKDANETAAKNTGGKQTWTLRNGLKVVGNVVGYARKDLVLQRRRGNIYVNDRVFDNLPPIYQIMIPKIVAHFEHFAHDDREALEGWLNTQNGQPRSFTIEGAMVQLENRDEYVVPFFFFTDRDQSMLASGWNQWLEANKTQQFDQLNNSEFLVPSLMAARQRDQQIQQQIAQVQLNQAVLMGNTSLWEVTLYPGRGVAGQPMWVVMPGINSAEATRSALAQYPGYAAGPVRKVAGY